MAWCIGGPHGLFVEGNIRGAEFQIAKVKLAQERRTESITNRGPSSKKAQTHQGKAFLGKESAKLVVSWFPVRGIFTHV